MTCALRLGIVSCVLWASPLLANQADVAERKASAQELFVAGEYEDAAGALEHLLADYPDDPDILRRLAAVAAAQGDLDSANALIEKAFALAPEDGDIQLARAYILLWRGDLVAARRQAKDLALDRPEYPGLLEFESSLRGALASRKLKLKSLQSGAAVSEARFARGRADRWTTQHVAAGLGWGGGAKATLVIEREERSAVDTQVRARADFPVGTDRLFLTGSVTPKPDFRASWHLGVGGEIQVRPAGHLLLDAGIADYRDSRIVKLHAGYRHRFSPRLSATASTIHLLGGGEAYRFGAVGRVEFAPHSRTQIFALVSRYPDTELDGTRQLSAAAAGVRFGLSDALALRISGGHESRASSYDRSHIGLDLIWVIGDGR